MKTAWKIRENARVSNDIVGRCYPPVAEPQIPQGVANEVASFEALAILLPVEKKFKGPLGVESHFAKIRKLNLELILEIQNWEFEIFTFVAIVETCLDFRDFTITG